MNDNRTLIRGDNLEEMRKFPDACIDLIATDPSFNSKRDYFVIYRDEHGQEPDALVKADDRSEVNLQRERKAALWWKRIALAFAFVISFGSGFLTWRKPPPELVVYITRTGKKYHTYDCDFLRKYNIEDKFAILLDKVKEDYDPCGVCNPERYSKTRKYVYTLKSNNSANTLARWRGFLTSPM